MERNTNMQYGIFLTIFAYIIWGLLPLYWKLLSDVSPDQILTARIVWSFAFMLIIMTVTRNWKHFISEVRVLLHDKKNMARITIASFVITLNWLTYIWAVNAEHVIQASLGYYINPLVSILLGIVILKESLTRRQAGAVILALAGVCTFSPRPSSWTRRTSRLHCGTLQSVGRLERSSGTMPCAWTHGGGRLPQAARRGSGR